MASTTKIWTLDLTANFLNQGAVHLNDLVTINAFEASVGGSLMTDLLGKSLEAGEVVKFGDLVRGMMYKSGNDAAYAVADHIAQALWGPAGDWHDFVALMNLHAVALGQTHTHFMNPNGFDDPQHYTSARDLAQEFQQGLQNPYFAKVVGFSGIWNATTQGPNGPKVYGMNWGQTYPGWEGEKGGNTTNCNGGPNKGCIVAAATRIGRRVVVGGMQAGSSDKNAMLDSGFASIFHPDLRATSAASGTVDRQAVDCYGANRAITAVLSPTGPVSVALWNADVDGNTLTKLTEATLPGSGNAKRTKAFSGDVKVSRMPTGDIIVATRQGSAVQLSRWTIARDGSLLLLASGIDAGKATTLGLQPVYGDTFLTAMTEPGGALVLKSWRLQGTGLVQLDSYTDASRTYTETSIAGPQSTDIFNGHRAVTSSLSTDMWSLANDVWGVEQATGAITRLGEDKYPFAQSNVTISPISVTPAFDGEFAPAYYAIAYSNGTGYQIRFIRIDPTGTPVEEGTTFSSGLISANAMQVAPLGTGGAMSASTDAAGNVRLVAWDARRQGDDSIVPGSVSEHDPAGATSLALCRLGGSTHAEGDYVTATRDLDGQLRLRAYRSGERPY